METAFGDDAYRRVGLSLRELLVPDAPSNGSFAASGTLRGTGGRPRVLAAVSGGADSVFLLATLHRLADETGFDLFALTVNHRMRDDAETSGDADFVETLCASLNPPVPCERVDLARGAVARLAAERGRGIEDAARVLRYRAFEEAAERLGGAFVATGHTRTDRLETILMRVLQGSSGASLAGIQPKRGRFIRPLLGIDRSEIISRLAAEGLSWREDSSNAEERFLRNRVRSGLVPALDEVYPGWRAGILSLSEKALLDEAACDSFAVPPWKREPSALSCDASSFRALPEAVRVRHLHKGLRLLGVTRRVSFRHVRRMAAIGGADSTRVSGAGVLFELTRGRLFLSADIVHTHKSGYLIYVRACGRFDAPFGTVDVSPADGGVALDGSFGPFTLPLVIRSRSGGDAVRTADGGHKSVKKLLNEWAVDGTVRDMLPVIECGGTVRAVYGAPFGYPDWLNGQ